MICSICLDENGNLIGLNSKDARTKNISNVLRIHFPFLENQLKSKNIENNVCSTCWESTEAFDKFYVAIREKHILKSRPEIENVFIKPEDENNVEIKKEPDPDIGEFFSNDELDNVPEDLVKTELSENEKAGSGDETDNNNDLDDSDWEVQFTKQKEREPRKMRTRRSKIESRNNSDDEASVEEIPEKKTKKRNVQTHAEREISGKLIAEHFKMVCDKCDYKFEDYEDFRNHFKESHSKIDSYLVCCNTKQFRLCKMLQHIKTHTEPNHTTCEYCNKIFTTRRACSRHKKIHTEIRNFACTVENCKKAFPSRYRLKLHEVCAHLPVEERSFCCIKCGSRFPTLSRLKYHEKIHNENRNKQNFVCDLCGKILRSKNNLKLHLDYHNDDDSKRIQCQICFHWLKNPNSYRRHILKHTQTTPADTICNQCGFKSLNRYALKEHIRKVHLLKRDHQCTMCQTAFKTPQSLKEHMATHLGEFLYECEICGKKSNSQSNMYAHRKKVHNEIWAKHLQPKYIKPISQPLPNFSRSNE